MNNKLIYIVICLFLSACVCDEPINEPSPIFNHLNNDVVMSKGFDYDSKKQITLDPFTGLIIKPCPHSSSYSKARQIDTKDYCGSEVILDDETLQAIMAKTREPIPVKVEKNGEIIDDKAYALITVNVLYKGSHCEITYSGGTKTSTCTTGSWLSFCTINKKYRYAKNVPASAKQAIQYCETHYWSK